MFCPKSTAVFSRMAGKVEIACNCYLVAWVSVLNFLNFRAQTVVQSDGLAALQ